MSNTFLEDNKLAIAIAGGMTIGILDSEAKNASYTADRKQSATAIQMSIAF